MIDDDKNHPDPGLNPSPDRPALAGIKVRNSIPVLAVLMTVGTSWVVASWVSAWLVPPYLILMALILLPSTGRPPGDRSQVERGPSETLEPVRPLEESDDRWVLSRTSALSESRDETSEATVASPPKGKRGKARARKTRLSTEPREATWIEVGPGKFVRSEAPKPSAESGPHEFPGNPVEAPVAPSSESADGVDHLDRPDPLELEPATSPAGPAPEASDRSENVLLPAGEPVGDACSAFGSSESREEIPVEEDEGPESSASESTDQGNESPGIVEDVSTADGIAPQVEAVFEETEADQTQAIEEDLEDPACMSAEVASEFSSDPEEFDPTETAVDETVLDDAQLFEDFSDDQEPALADDSRDQASSSRVPTRSFGWPRRFAPRVWTREGVDVRADSNLPPPRRPVRSQGPIGRPPDPRRLSRRGFGRPRQITRTFPPRSPPKLPRLAGGGRLIIEPESVQLAGTGATARDVGFDRLVVPTLSCSRPHTGDEHDAPMDVRDRGLGRLLPPRLSPGR